jgi:hypothetical protein
MTSVEISVSAMSDRLAGNNKDTQCAEINRQEIGGESPLPGKV